MNDGFEMLLQALAPTCGVCSGQLDGKTYQIKQLKCLHVFCQCCIQDLVSGVGFWCPFDEVSVPEIDPSNIYSSLYASLNCQYSPYRSQFQTSLDELDMSFSRAKVPCKITQINGNCPNPLYCKLDHSQKFYRKYPCPLTKDRGTCWRGDMCLFSHVPPVSYVSGTVTIRSRSLLAQIKAQNGRFFDIVSRYGAIIDSVAEYEVEYKTDKKWVFETERGQIPTEFEPEAQSEIAFAAEHHKAMIAVKDFRVYFRPQFLIMNDQRVFRVTCTSMCVETNCAGTVGYTCVDSWQDAFVKEIASLEMEFGCLVLGNKQINWCKRNGFGYFSNQIIGFVDDLRALLDSKPPFDEYDDIAEVPFEFNPAIHNLTGKAVEIFPGKLVGLRDDVAFVYTQTVSVAQATASIYYNHSLPAAGYAAPAQQFPAPEYYPEVVAGPASIQYATANPASARHSPPRRRLSPPHRSPSPLLANSYQNQSVPRRFANADTEEIERLVRRSMPRVRIVSIVKTSETQASRDFDRKLRDITNEKGRKPNTMMLFHGTKDDDPTEVAGEGLNDRERRGRYGVGKYFYEELRAVDVYSFTTTEGLKQTLVCEVITGDCLISEQRFYMKAPINPNTGRGFHSVQGSQRGSKLWVIYDDDMACAKFIVTYE